MSGDDRVVDGDPPDPESRRRATKANHQADGARQRRGEAHERASQVRERGRQISQRLDELSAQIPAMSHPTSAGVLAAEEAMRQAADAAERARRLALEAFEHAALAEESVARNHDIIADTLEERARQAFPEQRDLLLERADEHRAKAAHRRQEATVDRDAAERLRRKAPEPDGDEEPAPE